MGEFIPNSGKISPIWGYFSRHHIMKWQNIFNILSKNGEIFSISSKFSPFWAKFGANRGFYPQNSWISMKSMKNGFSYKYNVKWTKFAQKWANLGSNIKKSWISSIFCQKYAQIWGFRPILGLNFMMEYHEFKFEN